MRHYAGLKHEHTEHKDDQDPDQRVREDDSVPQFAIRHSTGFDPTVCEKVHDMRPVRQRDGLPNH
jgi:hypothetical protein